MASTYHDLYRIRKETLTIDSNTRETNQQVFFTNKNNVFNGTFFGNVQLDDEQLSTIVDGLSSTYQKRGNYISSYNDLSGVGFGLVRVNGYFTNGTPFNFFVLSSKEI